MNLFLLNYNNNPVKLQTDSLQKQTLQKIRNQGYSKQTELGCTKYICEIIICFFIWIKYDFLKKMVRKNIYIIIGYETYPKFVEWVI